MKWRTLASRATLTRILGFSAVLLAVGLVVVLALQNRELREQVQHFRRERRVLHEGVYVPAFRTSTLTGDSVVIGDPPAGGRQLLMILNARCPYCLATLPRWKRIVQRIRLGQDRLEWFAISLDPDSVTAAYVSENDFDVPVVRFPDERTAMIYRAIGVPITVVIGEGGHVLYGRPGEVAARSTIDSIYAALGIEP